MAVPELHPENADRLRNMHALLERGPLNDYLRWHDGRFATADEVMRFHTPAFLDELHAADTPEGRRFTPTTPFGAGSRDAALAAAGSAIDAMAHVLDGKGDLAYALVRPPGHHAAPRVADGYWFINNTALAAQLAIDRGAARIAILDWDVRHGNGTQEGFYERDDVLTVSFHMDHGAWGPAHPQTGKADEVGRGAGRGYNINVPLPMGSGDEGYLRAMDDIVVPAVDAFAPEMIVVAAGQDANQFDPNGRQCITMAGFRRLGAAAKALADAHSGGRLCMVQEGGYAMSHSAYCLQGTLEGVLGLDVLLNDPVGFYPEVPGPAFTAIENIWWVRAAVST